MVRCPLALMAKCRDCYARERAAWLAIARQKDMAMSGYPAKVKSFVWVGDEPYLATSGADEAIGWSFEGKDGPLGRNADTCAHGGNQQCTVVTGLVGVSGVLRVSSTGRLLPENLAQIIRIC